MFGKNRHNRPNRVGMIVVTLLGTCAGLCIGAVACIGIVHFLSR